MDVFAVMEVYFDQILLQSCYIKSQIYEYINFVFLLLDTLEYKYFSVDWLCTRCTSHTRWLQSQNEGIKCWWGATAFRSVLELLAGSWIGWDICFAFSSTDTCIVIQCTLTTCKEHKAPILTRIWFLFEMFSTCLNPLIKRVHGLSKHEMFSKYMWQTFTCHIQFMFLHVGLEFFVPLENFSLIWIMWVKFHPNLIDTKCPLEKRIKFIHMLFQRQIIRKLPTKLLLPVTHLWESHISSFEKLNATFSVKYLHMLL